MAVDYGILSQFKSIGDYDSQRRSEQLAIQAQQAQNQLVQAKLAGIARGTDLPAAMQLANEYQKAVESGNQDRANNLIMFSKALDKGIFPSAGVQSTTGNVVPQESFVPPTAPMLAPLPDTGNTAADIFPSSQPTPQQGQTFAQAMRSPVATGVATIPGYNEALAERGATVKGAEEAAKLQQKLQYEPLIGAQKDLAKTQAGKVAELKERVAGLPELELAVSNLSELGKKATYTTSGRAIDVARREIGLSPRESAVARAEYISRVDNQILPLLRQTFGAAFTEKEGQTLRQTLGDPNASPEEKDARLRAFIEQKKATIGTLERELGVSLPAQQAQPAIKNGTTATNPATGERMMFMDGAWKKVK